MVADHLPADVGGNRDLLARLWMCRGVGVRRTWRSLVLSLRYGGKADPYLPPILALSPAALWHDEDSEIVLGGTLKLGGEIRRGPSVFKDDRIVIRAAKKSRFVTMGTVHLSAGVGISVGRGSSVTIGENTHLGARSRVLSQCSIEIGSGCAISWDVSIMDFDAHSMKEGDRVREDKSPVRIGDMVWIGADAKILKGVSIGKGAIIGSGAVVTKDVPPGVLAAGNPARVIRDVEEWW